MGRRRRGNTIPATKLAPQRVRVSRFPPPIAMNSNQCTIWVRSEIAWNSKIQAINAGYNIKNALDEMSALDIFNEFRVKRINFWFLSKLAVTETGLNAFCVVDEGLAKLAKVDFASVSCMPGSDVKRAYQTLVATWYPTEPVDRDWKPIDNNAFCSMYFATTRPAAEGCIDGSIIADAHISLRGIDNPRKSHPHYPVIEMRPLPDQASAAEFSPSDGFETLAV